MGAVYLSDYEEELIDAELASLAVQGEMVAAGIGEVAVAGGETTVNRLDADAARQLLTRLVRPTGVRARLFSETGELLGDSAILSDAGRIHVMPLPPPQAVPGVEPHWGDRVGDWIARQLSRVDRFPEYVERAVPTVRDFPEAASALRGFNASAVRVSPDGMLIMSAAVPVQRYKQVLGALMLTRDNRAIAASLREVRYDMMVIAAAALGITVLLSLYLAGTITQPIVRLARAADEVRLARESRPEIPDLGKRGDEIGDLNDALRSMTDALWQRIGTIESFAADVAHELKNPLTSLRSAIEVAARPNLEPERREKLMGIVLDDINRLNRLITDISEASRLDAELMRGEVKKVDLNALLGDMVSHYAATAVQKGGVEVEYRLAANPPFLGHGHDGRYGQVFRNVIDNALSFSPSGSQDRGRAQPRAARRAVHRHHRRRGTGHSRGQPRIDLPALLLRAADRAFRPAFGARPLDLPADHGDLRRLDLGLQPPGARRPRAGRALHRARAGGRRPQVIALPVRHDDHCVHATCVALRLRAGTWRAVLLRGPSGAGKSDLALRLIETGWRLVADDQTELSRQGKQLIATAPARIAGLIEARGARHREGRP